MLQAVLDERLHAHMWSHRVMVGRCRLNRSNPC
jgi:hypothetical protein